jgi:hypothetical protein
MPHCPNLHRPLSAVKQAALGVPDEGDYRVSHLGGRFVIELSDRSLIDPDAIRSFITVHHLTHNTHNLRSTKIMEHNPYTYEAGTRDIMNADDLAGWLDRYDMRRGNASYVQKIGGKAKSLVEARRIQKLWGTLLRSNRIDYVTLDTDPTVKGRPQTMAPNVPAIMLIEMPEWHDHAGRTAVVYYVPTDTWFVDDDEHPGAKKELASYSDGAGCQFVIEYIDLSTESMVDFINDGRRAVAAAALARRFGDATPEEVEAQTQQEAIDRLRQLAKS